MFMATPTPPAVSSVQFDGELFSLRWEGKPNTYYTVEVMCPNWTQPYSTHVHEPELKLGLRGQEVMYRIAEAGSSFGNFETISAVTPFSSHGDSLLTIPRPPIQTPNQENAINSSQAAQESLERDERDDRALENKQRGEISPTSDEAWLRSLGVIELIAEVLSPLADGHPSLANALDNLNETTVEAHLRKSNIAAKLARVLLAHREAAVAMDPHWPLRKFLLSHFQESWVVSIVRK